MAVEPTSTVITTETEPESGGVPLSVAITVSSIFPSDSGSSASRSSSPLFVNQPVSASMLKLALCVLVLILNAISLFFVPASSPSVAWKNKDYF